MECYAEFPHTNYHMEAENPMAQKLKSLHPSIENAAAYYFFINNGRWREVIHEMKYRSSWLTAVRMGEWYGSQLAQSPLYQDIDIVVGVPLHPSRILKRGYNQSELIALGIARSLGAEHNYKALSRVRNNPSQVSTHENAQRWLNVQSLFKLKEPQTFIGKHILLVDDVFTTGATISSCVEAILEVLPTCRLSVATIAVSRNNIIGRNL